MKRALQTGLAGLVLGAAGLSGLSCATIVTSEEPCRQAERSTSQYTSLGQDDLAQKIAYAPWAGTAASYGGLFCAGSEQEWPTPWELPR